MRIQCIRAYRVELPLHEGSYKWSGGKAVSVFDSTVVEVVTDTGIVGYGEVCPLGPFYLPAYANGVRAGIRELGPHLIGECPLHLAQLNRRMDAALKGHPYVDNPFSRRVTAESYRQIVTIAGARDVHVAWGPAS